MSVEEPEAISFRSLLLARRHARRGKKPSHNMLAFETRWLDGLIDLHGRLNSGTWSPGKSTSFIATRPKAREIHAPDFSDRIVHHWLVPQLEQLLDRGFIHDSYANRTGKGTHQAVHRLEQFTRQVQSGLGGGWFLQLDIHNFFNSIHRPTLWHRLKPRLIKAGASDTVLHLTHALLRHPPLTAGVRDRATAHQRAQVPAHKQLANAAPGCGLPIGNLSSQFFANVYLDALDQFVKHTLKAPRYLRYVDDFVLIHPDRAQLVQWQGQIEAFLRDHLRLRLKPETKLAPLTQGIDFLGYVIRPTHTLVRRRVVIHARAALTRFEQQQVQGRQIVATPEQLATVRSQWASYQGHLQHASSYRLTQQLHHRYPWLHAAIGVRRRFTHQQLQQPITINF